MSSSGASLPAAALPLTASILGFVAITSAYLYARIRGDVPAGITNLPDSMPSRRITAALGGPALVPLSHTCHSH